VQIGAGHGKSPLQHDIRPLGPHSISRICAVSFFSRREIWDLGEDQELTGISAAGAHSGGAGTP